MNSNNPIKPTSNSKEKAMNSDKPIKPTTNTKEKAMNSDNPIEPTSNSKEKAMNSDKSTLPTSDTTAYSLETYKAEIKDFIKYTKPMINHAEGILINWLEDNGAIKFSIRIGFRSQVKSSRDLYRRKSKSSNIDHRFINPFKNSGNAWFPPKIGKYLYILVSKNEKGDILIKDIYTDKEYAEAISKSMNASYKLQSCLWELYEIKKNIHKDSMEFSDRKKSGTTSWKATHEEILYSFPEKFKPLLDANLEIATVEIYELENPYKHK